MILGGELGSNLGGTTLQFLLGGETRSGLELVLDLVEALDLELSRRRDLDLGHHLMLQHHLEIDLAHGLVLEVVGLHFVLRKRVGLGLVMAPLEWSIFLLLRPQGVPQWVGYDPHPFFLWLGEEFHHLHHKYHFAPLGSRYFRQTPRYTSPQ